MQKSKNNLKILFDSLKHKLKNSFLHLCKLSQKLRAIPIFDSFQKACVLFLRKFKMVLGQVRDFLKKYFNF